MIQNKVPQFKRGQILDSELLKSLRDTPYEFFLLTYLAYSRGVITGIESYIEDNKIIITPGIVKFNDFYYRIQKKIIKEIPLYDGDYILKIRFFPKKIVDLEKYYDYSLEIVLDITKVDYENEIELARIKRREGAVVRNFNDFLRIDKEFNIISEINKPQSSISGITLSNKILKIFARNVIEKKETEPIDDCACLNILNHTFNRETLNIYIFKKLGVNSSNFANSELYNALTNIYLSLKDNTRIKNNKKMKKNKMIVE